METAILVIGILATGGLVGGFGVFLYMRVVLQRSEKRARTRIMELNKENDDAGLKLAASEQQVSALRAALEAKNTVPTKPAEPRRIRARSMSQAQQLAEDEAAKDAR